MTEPQALKAQQVHKETKDLQVTQARRELMVLKVMTEQQDHKVLKVLQVIQVLRVMMALKVLMEL